MSDVPPTVVPYTVHPWVVANDRLRAVGWRPEHSNEEAFVAASELPRWREFLHRHRQEVALGGAASGIAGLAGGVTWAIVRRRRRRR